MNSICRVLLWRLQANKLSDRRSRTPISQTLAKLGTQNSWKIRLKHMKAGMDRKYYAPCHRSNQDQRNQQKSSTTTIRPVTKSSKDTWEHAENTSSRDISKNDSGTGFSLPEEHFTTAPGCPFTWSFRRTVISETLYSLGNERRLKTTGRYGH